MDPQFSLPNAWGAIEWLWPVVGLLVCATGILCWSYFREPASRYLKLGLIVMKIVSLGLLAICLLEPVHQYTRPEPGANLMVVMADDSQSLQIKDRGARETREMLLKSKLTEDGRWLTNLMSDFDVRRYLFDQRLRPVSSFVDYEATESGTNLVTNLGLVGKRFAGRPMAGVMVLTDGNLTGNMESELDEIDWEGMPPVYPVVIGDKQPAQDLGITKVTSTQTNFETSPVTITTELIAHGYRGQEVTVQLLNEKRDVVDETKITRVEDGKPFAVRFRVRPESRGVNLYTVKAFGTRQESSNQSVESTKEATLVNNEKTIVVDRGQGPYRVLYVSGRPNWELKFLRRAAQADPELDLVSLVRIAKKEAKFSFRGNVGQQSSSLFKGFESEDDDTTEKYDEPVLIRLGTKDKEELKTGFPKDAESLFQYQAIILDDVESGFFTEDQKSLINRFVSIRGGGLLMLGGQESFAGGKYARNQIGEMLPIYLDATKPGLAPSYKLNLTREGWLEPWVRIEATEDEEQNRLATMPRFKTINVSKSIKPGATVLATVAADADSTNYPALVVQPFGKGRAAALMVGDFWRWHMKTDLDNDDLLKSWRQTLRWLVADVPQRVDVDVTQANDSNQTAVIKTRIRDEQYRLFDNATVEIEIETPEKKSIQLTAEPSPQEPGTYVARFVSRTPGPYKVSITGVAEDGTAIDAKQAGWVSDLDGEEFQSLVPNRELLEQIAERSGGALVEFDELESFVDTLDKREVPITETRTLPWWHRWTIFSIAIGLLVAEWGIRRVKGLP